jgi:hypothetical protein
MEKLAKDTHTSLLQKFANYVWQKACSNQHSSLLQMFIYYVHKQFYNIVRWAQCYKTFLYIIIELLY